MSDDPVTMSRAPRERTPPPRRSAGWWVGLLLLGFVLFLVLGLLSALGSVGSLVAGSGGDLQETFVDGEPGARDRILLLPVTGMILEGSAGLLGSAVTSPSTVRRILDRARENDRIRGLLVEINSPGGGVTASDTILHEIRKYREETGVPVVAHFRDVAASGGYYVAMGADEVVAHPTTITGSIGVILQLLEYGDLFEKIGVEQVTILPEGTPYKDMGSPTREMTEEERRKFRSIVEEMYERFVEVVDAGRPDLDTDRVRSLADGSVMSAGQALEAGLVDALGYRDDAVDALRRRAEIEGDVAIITYQRSAGLLETLLAGAARSRQPRPDEQLLRRIAPVGSGLMYLWPGPQSP